MDNSFDLPPPFVSDGLTKILIGENIDGGLFTAEQLRAAVEAEREACAQVGFRAAMNGIEVAAAIRERGKS